MSEFNKHVPETYRLLNKDGTFNIERRRRKIITGDFYHSFLSASWPAFLGYILALYIGINILFGTAYWLVGPHGIEGLVFSNEADRWLQCFFFSVDWFFQDSVNLPPKWYSANTLLLIIKMVN